MSNFPHRTRHYADRLTLVAQAARALAAAINEPGLGLVGTDATREIDYLLNDAEPFAYLDDLAARCGVDTVRASALLTLAYVVKDSHFPDHYWTLYCAGIIPQETP